MYEYLSIKITTPEIEDLVAKYQIPKTRYKLNNYLLYDSKIKCFLIEHMTNVDIDLVVPTLEIFEQSILLLGLGLTLDEVKERLND